MIRTLFLLVLATAFAWGAKETYEYNAAGRLTGVVYGDGTRILYTYDAAGNLLSTRVEKRTAADPAAKAPIPPPRAVPQKRSPKD